MLAPIQNTKNKPQILLINLDKSQDRLAVCDDQLTQSKLCYERVPGVLGSALDEVEIAQVYDAKKNNWGYHKSLNKGEIGCYLSHRKAWQLIVEKEIDFAIVLEDDFTLTHSLQDAIDTISQIDIPWDCIKLAEFMNKRQSSVVKTMNNFDLVKYDKLPCRTAAQAISRKGAEKLLQSTKTFYRPVDIDMQFWWEIDLIAYGLKPYPVLIEENMKSEIDSFASRNNVKRRHITKLVNQIEFSIKNKMHRHQSDAF